MTARDPGRSAIEVLISESRSATDESRFGVAQDAAGRAVAGAEQLGDAVLLARAIAQQQLALRLAGDYGGALVCCTRILAMTEDPATRVALGGEDAAPTIARAWMYWVTSARTDGRADLHELLRMLDEAERWMTATGHGRWRSGILSERSDIYRVLGETARALEYAQEALARYTPGAPGFSHSVYRWSVGRLLSELGRREEAAGYLQAVLDDPDSAAMDRVTANVWLARTSLDGDRWQDADDAARAAVRLAEACGDDVLSSSLDVLVAVRRRGQDWPGATAAAARQLQSARRAGGRGRIYSALGSVVQVAIDCGDLDTARALLPELTEQASTLDHAQGQSDRTHWVDYQRERLAGAGPPG